MKNGSNWRARNSFQKVFKLKRHFVEFITGRCLDVATQERREEYVELLEIWAARTGIINLMQNPPARNSSLYDSVIQNLNDAKKHARRVEQLSQKFRRFKQQTRSGGRLARFVDAVLKKTTTFELDLEKELDSVIKKVREAEKLDVASRMQRGFSKKYAQGISRNFIEASGQLVTIRNQLVTMFRLEGQIDKFLGQPGA
ncbi:hypothetical protein HYU16_02425 [Candidatus Woesearchaeota archaeon]|nr:hypothetical protein [Candidatus Woesearchaeota archaeon]